MKKIFFSIKNAALLFTAILLSGCSGMLYTTIDVIKPARVTFPKDVNNIMILNYTTPQPHNYGHLTELFTDKIRKINLNTDSLPLFHLASLTQKITEKGFFNSVVAEPVSLNKSEYFFTSATPDDTLIRRLASTYQVEGILSLNRLLVTDQLAELYDQDNNNTVAYIEARYEMQWSVHFPEKKQVTPLVIRDTVYWESESGSRQKAFDGLPNRMDALIDGALIAGERAVNSFIPYWVKEDRYFFESSNSQLKAGIDSVYIKNWNGAITEWSALLENTSNPYLKVKTAHNLAVAYEITGDVKKAYEYSEIAFNKLLTLVIFDYKNFVTIANYNEIIKKRVNESVKISKQLGE